MQAKKTFKVYGSKGQSLRFGYLAIGLQCSLHADVRERTVKRYLTYPSGIETSVSSTPLLLDAYTYCDIVSQEFDKGVLLCQRGSRQTVKWFCETQQPSKTNKAYMRRDFQLTGRGRDGVKITPISASLISFANRCASLAPEKVKLIFVSFLASTSFFSSISVAIISAL